MGKLVLYFLSLLIFYKLIFIGVYFDKFVDIDSTIGHKLYSFISGLWLDSSLVAIYIVVIWASLFLYALTTLRVFYYLSWGYTYIISLITTALYIVELGVYKEWNEKPSFEILMYLKHPLEGLESNTIVSNIFLVILFFILNYINFKIVTKIYKTHLQRFSYSIIFNILFLLLSPFIILYVARGGAQEIPTCQSDAVYSKHKLLNDIAINTPYNFFQIIFQNQSIINNQNPYNYKYDTKYKQSILDTILKYDESKESPHIFKSKNINIVYIILESWAGDIAIREKYFKLIPYYKEMEKDGLRFTKLYTSGGLSHEGVSSILSGWPAMSDIFLTDMPKKFNKVSTISEELISKGYDTLFLFGGQLRYGNLTQFIYKAQFKKILELDDLKDDMPVAQLGIHDQYTLPRFSKEIDKLKAPFFATIFTTSTHSPFDMPKQYNIWKKKEYLTKYLNAFTYTDKQLHIFMQNAKKKSWYKDTVFVFISDHSHSVPEAWNRNTYQSHHIFGLIYGEPLKKEYRGYTFDKIASQYDISYTLLRQLDIKSDKFFYSRNLFHPDYKPSAYYHIYSGFGYLTPKGYYSYNTKTKQEDTNLDIVKNKKEIDEAKIISQDIMDKFIGF